MAIPVPQARPTSDGRAILDCAPLKATEQFDAWTDAVSRSFVPLSASPKESGGGFGGRLVSQSLGQAEISTVAGSSVAVQRSARTIAAKNPGYIKLGLQLRGYSVISQDDRDAALAPGDFAIYDTTRPYLLDFAESFEMFVVMFPVELLHLDRGLLSTVTASRFSGRRGLGAVTSSFLGELSRQLDREPLPGTMSLGSAVLDLVTATLAERLGPLGGTDKSAQRRALLLQIEQYLGAHLGDRDLTVVGVAGVHHVSVRYLEKLFEEQGETVSGWIRHRRLEHCRRDLASPSLAGRSVASIGAGWGFTDPAAFSRAFRNAFGTTPSDYRAASSGTGLAIEMAS